MSTFEDAPLGELAPGTIVEGRYKILRVLGRGGFAVVYEVEHLRLDRLAALKVLDLHGSSRDVAMFRERFEREAKLAARIEHPNVVKIYDYGFVEQNQQPYIAMELLRGHDLEVELERHGALDADRARRLFLPALSALGFAHEQGVVHKDLKPSNLFLCDAGTARERIVVLDYGIARVFDDEGSKLTATNQFSGTPAYIAPEYIERHEVSPALDVYQMGLIISESLMGVAAIKADSTLGYLMAHCEGKQQLDEGLLRSPVGQVLSQALAVSPSQRYANAQVFADALAQLPSWRFELTGQHRQAAPKGHDAKTWPDERRNQQPTARELVHANAAAQPWPSPPPDDASRQRQRSQRMLLGGAILLGLGIIGAGGVLGAFILLRDKPAVEPNPLELSSRSPGEVMITPTLPVPKGDAQKLNAALLGLQFTFGPVMHSVNLHRVFVEQYGWEQPELIASSALLAMPDNFKHGKLHAQRACAAPPAMPELDAACEAYVVQLDEMARVFDDYDAYYRVELAYKHDHMSQGKALKARLERVWGPYDQACEEMWRQVQRALTRHLHDQRESLSAQERLIKDPLIGAILELGPLVDAMREDPSSVATESRISALTSQIRALRQAIRTAQDSGQYKAGPYVNAESYLGSLSELLKTIHEAQERLRDASEDSSEFQRRIDRSMAISSVLLPYFQLMMLYTDQGI